MDIDITQEFPLRTHLHWDTEADGVDESITLSVDAAGNSITFSQEGQGFIVLPIGVFPTLVDETIGYFTKEQLEEFMDYNRFSEVETEMDTGDMTEIEVIEDTIDAEDEINLGAGEEKPNDSEIVHQDIKDDPNVETVKQIRHDDPDVETIEK